MLFYFSVLRSVRACNLSLSQTGILLVNWNKACACEPESIKDQTAIEGCMNGHRVECNYAKGFSRNNTKMDHTGLTYDQYWMQSENTELIRNPDEPSFQECNTHYMPTTKK